MVSIDTLPNDPEILKARLREQTEALEALTEQVEAAVHAAGEMDLRDEQLQHFHRLQTLGALTGSIAHQFNNILAAMLGFTEITQTLLPPDSPARSNLQEVYTIGQRGQEILRQTLSYSRSATTVSKPLAYAPMVTEVLGLLRASLPKTIEIHDEIAADAGAVLADPASMHHMLINLCTNAAQALGTEGRMDVKVDTQRVNDTAEAHPISLPPGDYIRLQVRDNGHGINLEICDRIFEPFFTTKAAQRMGLGLSIVQRIVNRYHGAIDVASTPGIGTAFTVYLPHVPTAATTSPQDAPPSQHNKGRILLIDDEVMLARVSQHILERLGYTVEMYTNPKEAIDSFRHAPHQFDLVITDLTMPDMNGVQVITILKVIRPNLPVILCTGFGYTLDEEAVGALGINTLLHKPIETAELARSRASRAAWPCLRARRRDVLKGGRGLYATWVSPPAIDQVVRQEFRQWVQYVQSAPKKSESPRLAEWPKTCRRFPKSCPRR